MGQFKVTAGAIVRPLGHPTDKVKTKAGENQLPGQVLTKNAGGYYEIAPTNSVSRDFCVCVIANLNKYDGEREVIRGHGTEVHVNVVASGAITPGSEVIYSGTTAGRVAASAGDGSDATKVIGKMVCLASEFWKDGITNTFSNAANNSVVTILLYQPTP